MTKSISKLNRDWHRAHRMPKNATLEQRMAWHLEHARICSCREMPIKLKEQLKKLKAKKD